MNPQFAGRKSLKVDVCGITSKVFQRELRTCFGFTEKECHDCTQRESGSSVTQMGSDNTMTVIVIPISC